MEKDSSSTLPSSSTESNAGDAQNPPSTADGQSPTSSPPSTSVLQTTRVESGSGWVITYPKAPISNVTTAVAAAVVSDGEDSDEELVAYLSAESDEEDSESFESRLKFKSGVQKPLKVVSPPVRRRARASVAPQELSIYATGNTKMPRTVDALVETPHVSSNGTPAKRLTRSNSSGAIPTGPRTTSSEPAASTSPSDSITKSPSLPSTSDGPSSPRGANVRVHVRNNSGGTQRSFSPARFINKILLGSGRKTGRSVDQSSTSTVQTEPAPQPTPQQQPTTPTQTDASTSPTAPKTKKSRKPRKVASSAAVETIDVGGRLDLTAPSSAPPSPQTTTKPKTKVQKAKSQGAGGMAIVSKKTGNSSSSDQTAAGKARSGSVIIKPAFSSMVKLGATSDTALFRHAWNVIDEYEEKRANALDAELEKKVAERLSQIVRRSARASAREQAFRIAAVQLPPDYTGPRLPARLTPDSIQTLITAFRNRIALHYKFMQQIFYSELVHLSQFGSTLQRIALPTGGKIIVVGDLHGQLQDLLTVLRKHGMPSDTNYYLFNGDFVDRGQYGIEVLSLIYAMRQVWPKSVFLNRGNHEHPSMNKRYKFEAQVTHSYDRKLYSIISQTFALLPFAALIDERVFVVHGGLTEFSDLSLKDIEDVVDLKEVPIHPRDKGEKIAKQLMWSDPANDPKDPNAARLANGFKANPRGAGVLWDSTITAAFCEKNSVELIVRSHQMMHNGYKYHHQQKLLTVFSASSYCGKNDNQGAVAIFDKSTLPKPQCASFHADVIEALEKASSKRPLEKIVSDVLRKIAEAVYDHRCDLLIDMASHDTALTGEITLTGWAASMKQHTSLALKWKELWPHVRYKDGPIPVSSSLASVTRINYRKFIERYSMRAIPKLWKRQRRHSIAIAVKTLLEAAKVEVVGSMMRALDEKQSGRLTYSDAALAVRRLAKTIPRDAMFEFLCEMDPRKFGFVHINSVVAELDLLQSHQQEFQWLWDVLSEDDGLRKRKLREFFDGAHGKRLDAASLCTFIQALSSGTSTSFVKPYDDNKAQLIRLIVHQVDMDDDGKISWQEFKQATRMLAPSPHVAIPPPARLLRIVRDHYDDIYVTFVSTDEEGTGVIEMDEFKSVLKTLVEVKKIDPIVEDDEMEALFYYLCTSPTQQSIMWRDVLNAASIIAADN